MTEKKPRKITKRIEKLLRVVDHISVRELPNGDWEVYDSKDGSIIDVIPREDIESADKRRIMQARRKVKSELKS